MNLRSFLVVAALLLSVPLSADLRLTSFHADPTGKKDSSPALQKALQELARTHGGTLIVPPGTFRLDTPVRVNLLGKEGAIVIRGEGSSSIFLINVGDAGTAITIQNAVSVVFENLAFVGARKTTDAHITLSLGYCQQARIRRCDFYGLASIDSEGGAVIEAGRTNLAIEASMFLGCTGHVTLGNPVVRLRDWVGLSIADTDFIDYGTLNGTYYSKTPIVSALAWVAIEDPGGVYGQNEIVLRRMQLDEGAYFGVAVIPTRGRIAHVSLSGLRVNGWGGGEGLGTGVYVTKTDHLRISSSWFGFATAPKPAIHLDDVKDAVLDSVVCDLEKGMTTFRVVNTQNLTIRNSVYKNIEGTPATVNIESSGRSSTARPVKSVTSSYTAAPGDSIIVASTKDVTVTLPAADAVAGHRLVIKNVSDGSVMVKSTGGNIDGAASKSLVAPQSALTVDSDGKNWLIVATVGEIR